jgi:hypothetical protein
MLKGAARCNAFGELEVTKPRQCTGPGAFDFPKLVKIAHTLLFSPAAASDYRNVHGYY